MTLRNTRKSYTTILGTQGPWNTLVPRALAWYPGVLAHLLPRGPIVLSWYKCLRWYPKGPGKPRYQGRTICSTQMTANTTSYTYLAPENPGTSELLQHPYTQEPWKLQVHRGPETPQVLLVATIFGVGQRIPVFIVITGALRAQINNIPSLRIEPTMAI